MSVVDNGYQRRLIVMGLFDGLAGVQGDEVAFIPTPGRRRIHDVHRGLLGDEYVLLTLKSRPGPRDPFATFSFRSLPDELANA